MLTADIRAAATPIGGMGLARDDLQPPLVYATTDVGRTWHELRLPTMADQKFGKGDGT